MIPFFLLDVLLYRSRIVIPCSFLLGCYLQKKWSNIDILIVFLLYDILFYQTYGFITLLLVLLKLLQKFLNKKKRNLGGFFLFFLFFFLGILLNNKLSWLFLLKPKVIITFLIQILLFFALDFQKKQKLYNETVRYNEKSKKGVIINKRRGKCDGKKL